VTINRDKLDAILRNKGVMTGAKWLEQRIVQDEERRSGRFEIERAVPGAPAGAGESQFWLVREDFPLDYPQGKLPLGAALESTSEHIAFSACDDELLDFNPRTACFVDTETIGLAGGAGTVAFLVGIAYWNEGALRLDQCFMRDFDEEAPMLEFIAERLKSCETVVGYNSKSFDLPLLRTRFIQNRIPFRGDGLPHLDLVHAARRFYKRRLQDCSLGNIEREVLGITRQGDVPSYLIPQMWFDYLRSRDARPLKGVFYHHRMDILSLVALTGWLSRCLAAPMGEGFEHGEDRLSVVRIHFRRKDYDAVLTHGWKFIETEERSPLRRECLEMLGMALKRQQKWEAMREAFELLIAEFPSDLTARLELAKLHEHRTRDLGRAMALCEEGIRIIESATPGLSETRAAFGGAELLRSRLERIQGKLRRGRGQQGLTSSYETNADTSELGLE